MNILQQLLERHFQTPPSRKTAFARAATPLQAAIIRLVGRNGRAIGISYQVREENVASLNSRVTFADMACRCRKSKESL
jgi:hypothetical protein